LASSECSLTRDQIYQLAWNGELEKNSAGVISSVSGHLAWQELATPAAFLRQVYQAKATSEKRQSLVAEELAAQKQTMQEINAER